MTRTPETSEETNINVGHRAPSRKQVTVVGTGVIGNGWITRFLANGYRVVASDLDTEAEKRTREAVRHAWKWMEKTGLADGASQDNLTFEPDLEKALAEADFVQENVPEREELKQDVIASIDRYAASEVVIASSTSGILPSTLQAKCAHHPERVIVAHPFNPVYLMPLVELVGGEQTEASFVEEARQFYEALGMKPLVVRREIAGHLADRLMEAVWRESLHIVNDGVATTEEIDASIVYGPGLRWALMGPFLTLHMGGGNAGMRHLLHQFGPALKLPWTRMEAPELTDELSEKVISGCEAQTGDIDMQDLEERRDQFLVELQELLEKYWPSANLSEGR